MEAAETRPFHLFDNVSPAVCLSSNKRNLKVNFNNCSAFPSSLLCIHVYESKLLSTFWWQFALDSLFFCVPIINIRSLSLYCTQYTHRRHNYVPGRRRCRWVWVRGLGREVVVGLWLSRPVCVRSVGSSRGLLFVDRLGISNKWRLRGQIVWSLSNHRVLLKQKRFRSFIVLINESNFLNTWKAVNDNDYWCASFNRSGSVASADNETDIATGQRPAVGRFFQ